MIKTCHAMATALLVLAACSDPAPTTGSLVVDVAGLPIGVGANIVVTGPNQFQQSLHQATTLNDLAPGEYQVRSVQVSTATALFGTAVASHARTIVAGASQSVTVTYALASGSIAVGIAGLPSGVPAAVRVVGEGISRVITSTGLMSALPPGTYEVVADTFASTTGDRFGASTYRQTVAVQISETPVDAMVNYALVSGSLSITVNGLAFGPADAISITGPAGFTRTTATTVTYRGLQAGTYVVAATPVSSCPNMYFPAVAQQTRDVVVGQLSEASVAYTVTSPQPQTLNLRIADAYLVQSVQRANGTVPIIAGRPALLRVFGIANQCNSAAARVKVRFSNGDSVLLNAPQSSALQGYAAAPISTSWNVFVPGDKVTRDLAFVAEIDPENAVAEMDESDNRYPAVGQKSGGVVDVPPLNLRFIPITQSGVTGDVNPGNTNSYLAALNEMLPLSQVNVSVGTPMTTQISLGNGGESQFVAILQEVEVRRIQDGNTGANYYGVLRPAQGVTFLTYGGMAYVPGKAAVGIQVGWFSNTRQATELVAHELSHSFGRRHAPCGAAGGPDPVYPYAGGTIGAYGYDTWNASDALFVSQKAPQTPDIMGYCQLPWISDYTFEGVLNFRGPVVAALASAPSERVSTLLVSGRIDGGTLQLDPAFALRTVPTVPTVPGPYVLEGIDVDGRMLFSTSFVPVGTDHGNARGAFFVFAIPLSLENISRVHEVRVTGRSQSATRRRRSGLARMRATRGDSLQQAGVKIVRRSRGEVELTWDVTDWPAILIRHPADGSLLSVGRDGHARVVTDATELQLLLSDGVQSLMLQARIP